MVEKGVSTLFGLLLKCGSPKIPKNYLEYLNKSQTNEETNEELFLIRKSVNKNVPLGNNIWITKMIDKFKLGQTIRGAGRPKNGG